MKKHIIIILLITFTMYACTSSHNLKLNRSELTHKQQVSQMTTTSEVDAKTKFETVFKDFKAGATEENVRALYAENFYFNDTFTIVNNIDDLVAHMVKTAEQVEITTVDIHEVIKGDNDYYLKWTMFMKFSAMGRMIESTSMGMTQLRFNKEGKIILHQDYWDGSEHFFEHLPVLGRLVKSVKSKL